MCVLLASANAVRAQAPPYIHIQAEGNRPFTATVNGAAYQSSTAGYLVVPQLQPGSYELLADISGMGEWVFPLVITDQPRAFTLKWEMDNSWSLFDMVAFEETRGTQAALWKQQQAARQKEAGRLAREQARKTGISAGISKIYDRASADGIDQVYVVTDGDRKDTIALFIPVLEAPKPKDTGHVTPPAPALPGGPENPPVTGYLPRNRNTTR